MRKGTFGSPDPFSLGLTLLCGQCFRWEGPREGWFQGIAGQAAWRLRQEGTEVRWECGQEKVRGMEPGDWLLHYLGAQEDQGPFYRLYGDHPILAAPVEHLRGLRLLRQEPWECAVSYMFAQGLSVPVIQKALAKFCGRFGRPLGGTMEGTGFPEPEDLADLDPDELKPFTNNYRDRARRVIRLARVVRAGVIALERFRDLSCDEAREALMALEGFGPKIADCALLFSLDHRQAFPVDRWVLRAMRRAFPQAALSRSSEAPTRNQYVRIVRKARKVFPYDPGLASEFLFLYLRLLEDHSLRSRLRPFALDGGHHRSFWEQGPPSAAEKGKGKGSSWN